MDVHMSIHDPAGGSDHGRFRQLELAGRFSADGDGIAGYSRRMTDPNHSGFPRTLPDHFVDDRSFNQEDDLVKTS